METTIAAISTPPGTGGIGIIRVSGPQALQIASRVFRHPKGRDVAALPGYHCMLGRVFDQNGEFDDCILTRYKAPRSYTGEEVVELSCHGGSYLLQRLLRATLAQGAQLAAPGEFTKRAFLNGKLGLTQAESVMDLISSTSLQASRAALAGRDGALFREIQSITSVLLDVEGDLAAWIDYPEEDMEQLSPERLLQSLAALEQRLQSLLNRYDSGRILREGITAAIVGRPNVGKSTLMNLLSGYDRSIVTDIPGTTRDIVEDSIRIGEIPLRLADTAGLRQTDDPAEKIGVALTQKRLEQSDLILAVFDRSQPLTPQDITLLESLKNRLAIGILNKTDLPPQISPEQLKPYLPHILTISAQTGEGAKELEHLLTELLQFNQLDPSAAMLVNERQRNCALRALTALQEAISALQSHITLDALTVCLDDALAALLELTGQRVSDQVVENVFARFCVGK